MRRVAVTGATGFIGRHVTARLAACGNDVRAIVRPHSKRRPPPRATIVRAPLTTDALARALADVDVVVHLAGVVSAVDSRAYQEVNVEATRAVAQACAAAGARVVHLSSLAAAGPAPATSPRGEDDPPQPMTEYGASKLAGERALASVADLRWTILRPGIVYGPGDRAMLPLFRMARRGLLPAIGAPAAAYTLVYIDDVVDAIDAAVERGAAGDTMFVGHATPVSVAQLGRALAAAFARPVTTIHVPDPIARLAVAMSQAAEAIVRRPMLLNRRRFDEMSAPGFVCRVDRIRERLGVVAQIDVEEGVRRTLAWYRNEGWI